MSWETAKPVISDDFGRTVAAGSWGAADVGGTWALTPGASASVASVAGGRGLLALTAALPSLSAQLAATSRDVEVAGSVGWSAVPVGGNADLRIQVRSSSTGFGQPGNWYAAWMQLTSGEAVRLYLAKSGVAIGSSYLVASGPYAPGTRYRFRFRVRGANPTTLEARAWADGAPEPSGWQLSTTDTDATIQARNTYSAVVGQLAGSAAVTLSIDDLRFAAVEPGTLIVGKAALDLDFGGTIVELECDSTALEITPNAEEIDVGTYCEPSATEQGRVTYSALVALLWSPALYTKLAPYVGQDATLKFYPEAADTSRYITFATRYAALPWGRFELGQRVEVDLPLAVLSTPDYVGELA